MAAEHYGPDITDFRSQLEKLFAPDPGALHLVPQSEFSAGTIIKQAREIGYAGPIYAETVTMGTTSLDIAGEAATGVKAIVADLDPDNEKAQEVLANFRERYNYVTLPWHLGSAYDDVYIAAECLRRTNNDQDADGFRDCMYEITWSGAIGDNYSFDSDGEVEGLSRVVVEVLPLAERTADRSYRVLGPAPGRMNAAVPFAAGRRSLACHVTGMSGYNGGLRCTSSTRSHQAAAASSSPSPR